MGEGIAFASGLLRGMVDAKKRKSDAEKDIELKRIETEAENMRFLQEQIFGLAGTKEGIKALTPKLLYEANLENMINLSNLMEENTNGYTISGDRGQSLFIPFSQEYDPSKANYYVGQLDDIDSFVQTNPGVIQSFLQNNPTAQAQFMSDMGQLEDFASRRYTKDQKVAGYEGATVYEYDFEQNHPFLFGLSKELNISPNYEAGTQNAIKEENIVFDPETEAVLVVPFQGLESGSKQTTVPLVVPIDLKNGLTNIASRTGFNNVDEYIANFMYFDANLEREDGESKEAYILRQNKHLELAVQFENMGYGSIMRGEKSATNEELKEMLHVVAFTAGPDLNRQTMALAALLPVKPEFFRKSNTNTVFSKNKGKMFEPKVTVKEYVMEIYGIKEEQDFMNGVEATERALSNLERLIAIETEELEYTGFVRSLFATMEGIGDQISQIGKGLDSYFGSQADIGSGLDTVNGTTEKSLMQVVERVNRDLDLGINLTAMTEADVLRLTLAADMARAVDPSGRLSNQDFEIQLRRLGATKLGTKEQIKAALNTVRNQFARDIKVKQQIGTSLRRNITLDATTARRIQADALLADFKRRTYEQPKASKQTEVPSSDVVPFPADTLKSTTVPAYGETPSFEGVYLPKATGPYTPGWYVQDQETGIYRPVSPEERQAIISMSQ